MLEQLKRLFNHFHEAIYIVDTHRKILYYNPEAEKISGFTKEEMIGTHCWDNKLNHIDEKGKKLCLDGCPLQQSIRENIITDNFVYLQHKKGYRKLVHVRAIPLEIDGKIIGAIEVFTDETTKSMLLEEEKLSSILTYIDPLTGLLNRMFMQVKLNKLLADKKLQEWGLCFIDLDNFKRTNDVYGHVIGDKLLEAVAHTILDNLHENDLAFRYGGDELIVMFHHVTKEELLKKASLLQTLIQATRLRDIEDDKLTETSIGVTLLRHNVDLLKAIEVADQAMYIAKKSGKNKIQFLDMDEY
jgi:diguanylate cyclase (GGDEF)-like protein/PAS domain S-box-containing protein